MVGHSRAEELAQLLPEQWRAGFVHFVETGEAEKSFLDFLESDKTAKAAVETVFSEQAAAFEGPAGALRSIKTETAEIGDVMPEGDAHAGYSYAGEDRKGKLWVAVAPKLMNHFDAARWAEDQGGSLPTREEGKYLDSVKGKLSELFNLSGSYPEGYIWLAEPYTYSKKYAWCQDLSTGNQNGNAYRNRELPVLCVRR